MKFDGETLFALVLLIGPLAALAFWHAYEWGSGFGLKSGLWRTSAVQGTRTFSAVGWLLFAGWAFLALLGLFARTYRS